MQRRTFLLGAFGLHGLAFSAARVAPDAGRFVHAPVVLAERWMALEHCDSLRGRTALQRIQLAEDREIRCARAVGEEERRIAEPQIELLEAQLELGKHALERLASEPLRHCLSADLPS